MTHLERLTVHMLQTFGVASHLESAAGFLMDKEINASVALLMNHNVLRSYFGWSKFSDKIGVIENLLEKADKVIIGGGMAYTFAKARGKEIGGSLLEADELDLAKELMARAGDKLILPIDATIASGLGNDAVEGTVSMDEIPADMQALDIGPETIKLFEKELEGAEF